MSIIRWASPKIMHIFTVSSVVEELLHHISVTMTRKMEISRYPVDFEPSLHPAAPIRFEVTFNPSSLLSTVISFDEEGVVRQVVFLYGLANIYLVNF